MTEWAELIRAIASLLWPIFAFTFVFLFRKRLEDAIARIRKGKVLGQEVELADSLESLQRSATELSDEVAAIPSTAGAEEADIEGDDTQRQDEDVIKCIIHEAARSPTAALILLAAEIEKEAKVALASSGLLEGRKHVPLITAVKELDSHMGLPRYISSSLKLFWETRNRLVHGERADERNVLSAIDSGISILKSLQAIPREVNIVENVEVMVYSDSECKYPIPDVKAVILRTQSVGGARESLRVFPTTRQHFSPGKRVAWEWNLSKSWPQAWYRDPETNEIKSAWHSSGEFVGRNLDEI